MQMSVDSRHNISIIQFISFIHFKNNLKAGEEELVKSLFCNVVNALCSEEK